MDICHEVKQGKATGILHGCRSLLGKCDWDWNRSEEETQRQRQRERETTGEITLITHTVHLAASWNHTLFLHSPPSITVSTDTRHEEACFLYSSFHVFCTAVIYHYVPSILAPEIKRCMSIKHWGALYISHARSSFCTVVRSNSFLLVWLCEDSHTPSTERTKVSDSDTAVIT